jgi:DUF971 family protein
LERTFVPGKRHVKIRALEPVGHYATRIVFDDGHDSGLFTGPIFSSWGASTKKMAGLSGRPGWQRSEAG